MATPNFGSSFADAFLGTMQAYDAHKKAQREEEQYNRIQKIADTYETAGNQYTGDHGALLDEKQYAKWEKAQGKAKGKDQTQSGMAEVAPMTAMPVTGVSPSPITDAVVQPQTALPTIGAPQVPATPPASAAQPPMGLPPVNAAPAAAVAPMPQQPMATPEARLPQANAAPGTAPAPKPQMPEPAPTAGETVSSAEAKGAAPLSEPVKGPEGKSYVKVMVDGKVRYAPADSVKQLSGPDLYRAQADALDRLDPAQAMALRKAVVGMESDQIKLNTEKVGQGVMQAKAALLNGDLNGFAKIVASTYNTAVPDGVNATVEQGPNGPVMVRTDVSGVVLDRTDLMAVDPETNTRNVDMIVMGLEDLTNPSGMRDRLKFAADMRTNSIGNALTLAQTERTKQQTRIEAAEAPLRRGVLAAEADSHRSAAEKNRGGLQAAPNLAKLYTAGEQRVLSNGDEVTAFKPKTPGVPTLYQSPDRFGGLPVQEGQWKRWDKMSKAANENGLDIKVRKDGVPVYAKGDLVSADIMDFVRSKSGRASATGLPDSALLKPGEWVSPITDRIMPPQEVAKRPEDVVREAVNAARLPGRAGMQARVSFANKYGVAPQQVIQQGGLSASHGQETMVRDAMGATRVGGIVGQQLREQFTRKYGVAPEQVIQQGR